MLNLLRNDKLFAADITGGGGDILNPATKDDYLSALNDEPEIIDLEEPVTPESPGGEEDEEKPKDKKIQESEEDDDENKEKDKKDDGEDDDELEELEKELQGPTDEQLELMTPARRKDILTKYPKLFKDFPYLETAYYRDQKFTEVFPTIKEAEQAAADLRDYAELAGKIKSGDLESVITDIAKDQKVFHKMVDNYLPLLAKVNSDAYHHIVGNLIKFTIKDMVDEAKGSNNESLKTAASILHQFVFGNTKWTPPTNLSTETTDPKQSAAETELEKKQREFNLLRFNTAQTDVASRVDNAIKATVLMHIDPKKVMTDYIKDVAVEKALNKVGQLMNADTRFKSLLDKLWREAATKNFDRTSLDKIKGACVSKARTLLRPVIQTARNEALKGMGKRVVEDKEEKEEDTRQPKTRESAPQNRGQKVDKSKPQAGESSLDFLLRD